MPKHLSETPECPLKHFDVADLAWAAGFFDGEGTTIARNDSLRPGYWQLQVSVPQSGHTGVPVVLTRFQAAVLGLGGIEPPNAEDTYMWRASMFEEAQAVIALLWRHLGPVKREQAASALRAVREQYESGRVEPRRSRRPSMIHAVHDVPAKTYAAEELEHAWAAGFLDAEGWFGLARAHSRKRLVPWYRIRVSASQHGAEGIPAAVLIRLQRAFDGLGRIERHGEPDDFKWLAEGRANVERVLLLASPWLGIVKLEQARKALAAYDAQPRSRGDKTICIRGHPYDVLKIRDGRIRRRCNRCARITARGLRAAAGIKPRQFKNVERRYTS